MPLSTLTTGNIGGTGTFDVLADVVFKHLDTQFKKSRIKGSEYAVAYTEIMGQLLTTATAYDLEYGLARLKEDLLEKEKTEKDINLTFLTDKLQCELEICHEQKIKLIKDQGQIVAATHLSEAQILKLNAETDNVKLTKQKIQLEIDYYPQRLQLEIDILGLEKSKLELEHAKLQFELDTYEDRIALEMEKLGLERDKLGLDKQKLQFEIDTYGDKLALELEILGLQKIKLKIESDTLAMELTRLNERLTLEIANLQVKHAHGLATVAKVNADKAKVILETAKLQLDVDTYSDRLAAELAILYLQKDKLELEKQKLVFEVASFNARLQLELDILGLQKDKLALDKQKLTLEIAVFGQKLALELDKLELEKDKLDLEKQKVALEIARYADRITLELELLEAQTEKMKAEAILTGANKDMVLLKLTLEPQRLSLEIDKLTAEKLRIENDASKILAEKLRISAQIAKINKEISTHDAEVTSKLVLDSKNAKLLDVKARLVCYQVETEKYQKEAVLTQVNLYKTQARGLKGKMKLDHLKINSNLYTSVGIADSGIPIPEAMDKPHLTALSDSIGVYLDNIDPTQAVSFVNQAGCDTIQYP